jgi:hypothetical protein
MKCVRFFIFTCFSHYRTDAPIMRKERCDNSGNSKARGTDIYVGEEKCKEFLRATFNSADGLVLPAVIYLVTLGTASRRQKRYADLFNL